MIIRLLKVFIFAVFLLLQSSFLNFDSVAPDSTKKVSPPFLNQSTKWADSVFASLTPDERICQLFMVAAFSNKENKHVEEIKTLLEKHTIGGMIFMQGTPMKHTQLVNYYQKMSKVPMMIGMDAEWGLGMRLDSSLSYPKQMMLGAIQNNELIYEMGQEIARQCKEIGIHINFSPVLDINSNPNNPVINDRSFGEIKNVVAHKGFAYMLGMQDNGVLAVGKHFPGHGDTDKDSHITLPVVRYNWNRLDTLELYPFRELIKAGIGGIMVAHLFVPTLDSTKNQPTTLSRKVVTDLLQDEMGFEGLIFTDALNMKGIADNFQPGEVEAKAFMAGNDILLFPKDIDSAIIAIKCEIEKGTITWKEINRRCMKVLKAKQWLGLNTYKPAKEPTVNATIRTPYAELLNRRLVEASLTLIKNEKEIIPFQRLDTLKIALVSISEDDVSTYRNSIELYTEVAPLKIDKTYSEDRLSALGNYLVSYNTVVVSLHSTNRKPHMNFGITREVIDFVDSLAEKTTVVLNVFTNPYCLSSFHNLDKVKAILVSYEDTETIQDLSAQLLFGGIPSMGKLPVTLSKEFPVGTGIVTLFPTRLKYTVPEELNMTSQDLSPIDSLALDAISRGATPGCQILIARHGKVFYHKSFGYHTYEKKIQVKNSDIYDLASITKITATLPSLMALYDSGKFSIDSTLSYYLPFLGSSTKANIVIKDVLTHQAQLNPWIPFYLRTLTDKAPNPKIYSSVQCEEFPIQVYDDLYIIPTYKDTMLQRIADSKLCQKKEYKYSDLGFYLMKEIAEDLTCKPLNEYTFENYYAPLGATTMGYLPLKKFDRERIVPTQDDKTFRKHVIAGHVHDPGAAMLGGVAGHAGVFSNANDLAKMMQMYLQKGTYGGKTYFSEATINFFSSAPYNKEGNRRGLGFDKPEMDYKKVGPTCQCISGESFGHTGFTGTIAWVDPDKDVLFIFLSNRIHPDQENKELIKSDVRSKIQEVIYSAVNKSDVKKKTTEITEK